MAERHVREQEASAPMSLRVWTDSGSLGSTRVGVCRCGQQQRNSLISGREAAEFKSLPVFGVFRDFALEVMDIIDDMLSCWRLHDTVHYKHQRVRISPNLRHRNDVFLVLGQSNSCEDPARRGTRHLPNAPGLCGANLLRHSDHMKRRKR